MITHTSDSYQIPSQNKTRSKLQIFKIVKNSNFAINFTRDTPSEVAWSGAQIWNGSNHNCRCYRAYTGCGMDWWTSSVLRCLFSPNLVILTWTTDELWCRQAQNEVKFDFQVKFDLEGQGRSSQKTIGNLTVQTSLWLMYTPTHRSTDAGGDNTRRPKLASGKNAFENVWKMAQPQCLIQLDTGNLCNILYDTLQKQCYSADSRFAPSQWKRSLRSNAVSHWLGRKPRISPDVIILYLFFC